MDILIAQNILQTIINQKQKEIDIFALALEILNDKFAPDITAIALAQKDADDLRLKVAEVITQRDTVSGEKVALLAEKILLQAELETTKAELLSLTPVIEPDTIILL